jgi:hypothetical protein
MGQNKQIALLIVRWSYLGIQNSMIFKTFMLQSH